MQNTTEFLTEDQLDKEDAGRKIGIVMVKKEHIKSLQVKQNVMPANYFMIFLRFFSRWKEVKSGRQNSRVSISQLLEQL